VTSRDIDIFEDREIDKSMFRSDGSKKSATGFLGPIKNLVTGGTMTEFTTNWEDAGIEIPTMVPTLSAEEIEYMRRMEPGQGWDRNNPIDASILRKAKDHARMRIAQGKSPYFQDGEDQVKKYQSGGAVDDIDIFEETRRMIRDDQTPMMPTVTNEQPMFEMPGVDRVFTQIVTSPDFRSIVRVEDLPPENLQESKKIFEFLMKRDGIDKAVQYLVDTFGKTTMFPIERSLGPDPRTQRVMGMDESVMSSGIGSLMQ